MRSVTDGGRPRRPAVRPRNRAASVGCAMVGPVAGAYAYSVCRRAGSVEGVGCDADTAVTAAPVLLPGWAGEAKLWTGFGAARCPSELQCNGLHRSTGSYRWMNQGLSDRRGVNTRQALWDWGAGGRGNGRLGWPRRRPLVSPDVAGPWCWGAAARPWSAVLTRREGCWRRGAGSAGRRG